MVLAWLVPANAAERDVGARVAYQLSDQGAGLATRLHVAVRPIAHVAVGAYGEASPFFSPILAKCGGCVPDPVRPWRAGGFVEAHFQPTASVDPFASVAVGFVHTRTTAPDVEVVGGVHWVVGAFAAGPFAGWVFGTADNQPRRMLMAGGSGRFVF